MRPIRQQTLNELEGVEPGSPPYLSTLVLTCHQLRTKPIGEFSPEDLRVMIGQRIGLAYLLPLALERLEGNPWTSGDLYPGDLLKATALASGAGQASPELLVRLATVIDRALREIETLPQEDEYRLPNLDVPGPELAEELAADLRDVRERLVDTLPPAS
jgi:hypothetical protein